MKKLIIAILVIAVAIGVGGYIIYNKPHKDLTRSKADFTLTAIDLQQEFAMDEKAAGEKYLGKVIEVSGQIAHIHADPEGSHILLASSNPISGVQCTLLEPIEEGQYQPEHYLTIRGVCSGLLFDVVLSRCIIVD